MVTGEYNAERYRVFDGDEEVYQAGNMPGDSQAYGSSGQGVGLNQMKAFCTQTTHDIAEEKGKEYGGVAYDPIA